MNNINVFSGPMKCGKSQKILDEANRQKIAGKNFKIFKPSIDNRFGDDYSCHSYGIWGWGVCYRVPKRKRQEQDTYT